MPRLDRLTLRAKQTLIIMLASIAVLLASGAAVLVYETFAFRRDLTETVSVLADAVGTNCAAAIDFDDAEAARDTLGALRANTSVVAAGVYTRAGSVLATYQRDPDRPEPLPEAPGAGAGFAGDRLRVFRPISQRGAVIGAIVVTSDLEGLAARRRNYVRTLAVILPGAILVALVLSWRLGRLITEPIVGLSHMARAVTEHKNYAVRAVRQSRDELGVLVDAFNEMLARIEEREAALQRSHAELEERVARRTLELATSLALVRATLESTPDGVLVTDAAGVVTGFNERFRAMWHLDPQAMGEPAEEAGGVFGLVAAQTTDPDAAMAQVRDVRNRPEADSFDVLTLRDGRTVERYAHPQRVGDVSVGRVWSFRDVTERRRLEAQIVESTKIESVGRLAGGVAHEFNSIMTAIIGHSDVLLDSLPAGHPLSGHAAEIHDAGERAALLTQQLLAFGRRQMLRPETIDLNDVLGRIGGVIRHLMGASVDVRIAPRAGVDLVRADASQIEQVVIHFAMRARDAMPSGGTFVVDLDNVMVRAAAAGPPRDLAPGRYVVLRVADSGVAMDAHTRAAIFEPFAPSASGDAPAGLALATCYGVVKQSGGHIDVESAPGRGTTFRIYLPPAPAGGARRPPDAAVSTLPRGTGTVLLVESDAALREMAAELLGRLGYAVLSAPGAAEALRMVDGPDTEGIDLLISDVAMPHTAEADLIDRIRVRCPSVRILYTGPYARRTGDPAVLAGTGTGFLAKPYVPGALARAARDLLRGPDRQDAPR